MRPIGHAPPLTLFVRKRTKKEQSKKAKLSRADLGSHMGIVQLLPATSCKKWFAVTKEGDASSRSARSWVTEENWLVLWWLFVFVWKSDRLYFTIIAIFVVRSIMTLFCSFYRYERSCIWFGSRRGDEDIGILQFTWLLYFA